MKELVCYCKNVSKTEIETAISEGAKTLKDIQKATGACTGNQCKELNPNKRCCSVEILVMLNSSGNGEPKHCSCCA
ncbi:MAG: (2Fe-2S)-binding protein [Bacteroidetes bacterium]|nr:(2Fe-2S)-binding protein [Bacteroidota bacterium]